MSNERYKKDLIGKVFGKLKVIDFAYTKPCGVKNPRSTTFWLCECECGNKKIISRPALISGLTISCGCAVNNKAANSKEKVFSTSVSDIQKLSLSSRNSSGIRGINFDKNSQKWKATIQFQKKRYYLGLWSNIDDAVAARKLAEKNIYGEFLEWCNGFQKNGGNPC